MNIMERIKANRGRLLTLRFVKKDGSMRYMRCLYGINRGLSGRGLKYVPEERGLLPVYDIDVKGYRMINLGSVEINHIENFEYSLSGEKF